jgi:hypothetical protein
MKKQVIGSITMGVLLYVVLTICSSAERYVVVAVGSHYSQSFAAEIQQLDKLRAEQLRQNPEETLRTGQYILYARRATRAVIAVSVSAFIFLISRMQKIGASQEDARSGAEPNNALQPTATVPPALTKP